MRSFIRVNCAAISPGLLESEFFGYERGAFTGASASGKKGYFEMANNGTLFLDEVSELPLDLQAKLLRVIQDGEYFRVGGTEPRRTNVRIIAATNRSPEALLGGRMRRDLYYRLSVFPIRVPSLDERREEIPVLATYFLTLYNEKFGLSKTLTQDALSALRERSWPGNIRELENMIQRLIISSASDNITEMDVIREPQAAHRTVSSGINLPGDAGFTEAVEAFENRLIAEAYVQYGSSRKAAEALGISQSQFMRKKRRLQENTLPHID